MPNPRSTQRPLNPKLRERYQRDPRASWLIARLAGFPHQSNFSSLIRAEVVPTTPLVVERLRRVAELLDFPKEEIFLDGDVDRAVEA